jgi:hypothetical protein
MVCPRLTGWLKSAPSARATTLPRVTGATEICGASARAAPFQR